MGYVNGNLVKSTGATPVFKVDVCSDNSPHCWEGLPIVVKKPVSHKGVVRPWLSLGAGDLCVKLLYAVLLLAPFRIAMARWRPIAA